MRRGVAAVGVVAAVAGGIVWAQRDAAVQTPQPTSSAHAQCTPRVVRGEYLPDAKCTPGALNPAVTAATLRTTICRPKQKGRPGWSEEARRALSGSRAARWKRELLARYGEYGGRDVKAYELDHLVPISLGGAVADKANLWPELEIEGRNRKDSTEARALAAVCNGRLELAEAQRLMREDWTTLADALRVPR